MSQDTPSAPKDNGPAPVSRLDKLSYEFDTWYTTNPNAQVVCLAFACLLCVFQLMFLFGITGSMAELTGFEYYAEMAWMAWGQLSDTGGSPNGELWGTRFVGVINAFMGMFVFSLICAFIEEAINAKLEALRKGKSKVLEASFSLIIGWSDRTVPLVRQLCLANESNPNGGIIVILADKDKEYMDGYLADNLDDLRGSSVVTRMGQPIDLFSLNKVNAKMAKSITVLSTIADADESDAQTTRVVLALTGALGVPGEDGIQGHVVCEVCDIDNAEIVRLGISDIEMSKAFVKPVVANDLTGRLMILCALEPGLARVFSHILEFDQNEFYFKNWNGEEVHYDSMGNRWAVDLTGKRFADVCFLFEHAVPFGIHLANPVTLRDPDGTEYTTKIMVNPQGDWVIDEGDEIIVIAEDDDSYYPGRLQMVDPGPTPVMSEAAQMPVNLMLVGFRRDLDDMISEVDKWVAAGSTLMLFNDTPVDIRMKTLTANGLELDQIKNTEIRHFVGNPMLLRNLEEVRPQKYNGIIVLTEKDETRQGMECDSRTMVTTLLIRDIQRQHNAQSVLVSEILDPRTSTLVKLAKMNDFICANDFVSMALAQMSEESDIHALIEDLFSPLGSEMHIKDIKLYANEGEELNFWELVTRARNRAEVCLGWIKAAEYEGGSPVPNLNPVDKQTRHVWRYGDQLVVLAEE